MTRRLARGIWPTGRRGAAWLGVVALLIQCVVAATHIPQMMFAAGLAASAQHSSHRAIQDVKPGGEHDSGRHADHHAGHHTDPVDQPTPPASPGKMPRCPICLALHAGGAALVPSNYVIKAPHHGDLVYASPVKDAGRGRGEIRLVAQPRAPPVSV